MMRLLLVELTRFRSRRAIVLLILATMLVATALVGSIAYNTRPLTAGDRADAAAKAEMEGQKPEIQTEVRACRADPTGYLGPEGTPGDCEAALLLPPDSFYPREALDLVSVLEGRGLQLALVVVGLMVVAGCTFVGADWVTGSLVNQLLFEPRRLRLWLAKASAVTIGSGLVAATVLSGFWLALAGLAQARGIDVSSDVPEISWHVVRAVALAMGAGLGVFALTMVFRHTVATLALLFVYSVGGEIVVNLIPVEGAGRWSVGNNALGWLATTHSYVDATIACTPGERCSPLQVMTHLEAGWFLGALLLVAVVFSLLWFSRRDV